MSNLLTKAQVMQHYAFIHDTIHLLFLMDKTVESLGFSRTSGIFIDNEKNNVSNHLWKQYTSAYFPSEGDKVPPSESAISPTLDDTYNMIFNKVKNIMLELNLPTPEPSRAADRFIQLRYPLGELKNTLKLTSIYAHAPVYQGIGGTLTYWNHKLGGTKSSTAFSSTLISALIATPLMVCAIELGNPSPTVAFSVTMSLLAIAMAALYLMVKYNNKTLVKYAENYDQIPSGLLFIDERSPADKQAGKLAEDNCLENNPQCKFHLAP